MAAIGLVSLLSWTFSSPPSNSKFSTAPIHQVNVDDDVLKGDVITSKIGNETLKAELGRAGWRLLHTTMAKFPDKPTKDEQTALFSYIHLFARLYPWSVYVLNLSFPTALLMGICSGECAGHFRQILNNFPPQVSTRSNAAAWACHVHNEVNKSLDKELFDCSKIGDFYDCGCADEEEKEKKETKIDTGQITLEVERSG